MSSIYVETNDSAGAKPSEEARTTTAELRLVDIDGTDWLTIRITRLANTRAPTYPHPRYEITTNSVTQTYDGAGLRNLQRAISYFLPDTKP